MFVLVAVFCADAQLLYKITGKNLEKPSYIIGTYHLAPASFVDSIPGAKAAFESVEQVCGEVDMAEMESMESTQKLMAAMMLPDGKSLSDVLTADEMDRLNAYMKATIGADLTNPLIKSQMGCMIPMAISTQLQLVQFKRITPDFNPMALIDSYFQQAAKKTGKPVIGFETVDFQISVLYTGSTIERQKQQLFCMIDNAEYSVAMLKELVGAYFAQDMAKLYEVTEEKRGDGCDSTPEEDEALIFGRNADWVEKMPAIMADKATLFVVGAAHLPGERGVLELLEKQGYTVEAVKLNACKISVK
jgi:uncharacterized protein YbaP (TraB family)